MRRFLIWSGLAALIGLILAVVGVWAYGHFYARFQPVTLDRNQADVERLLSQSSWIARGEGGEPAVYVVGAHDDPATRAWLKEEADKVRASGAQVRTILFVAPNAEGGAGGSPADRTTAAELWLGRDPQLLDRWLAARPGAWTAADLTPADGNLARMAVADAASDFSQTLKAELSRAGVRVSWPMVIWRDREGFLRACACSDRRSWAFVRDELHAPEAIGAPSGDPAAIEAETEAEATASTPTPAPLPYPDLTPAPIAPAGPPKTSSSPSDAPSSADSRPAPPSRLERPTPRPAPAKREPSRPRPPEEEDTRFY